MLSGGSSCRIMGQLLRHSHPDLHGREVQHGKENEIKSSTICQNMKPQHFFYLYNRSVFFKKKLEMPRYLSTANYTSIIAFVACFIYSFNNFPSLPASISCWCRSFSLPLVYFYNNLVKWARMIVTGTKLPNKFHVS